MREPAMTDGAVSERLKAPFPWFGLAGDAVRLRCADAEARGDVLQERAVLSHRASGGDLVLCQSRSFVAPFGGRAPRSTTAVRIGVPNVLGSRRELEVVWVVVPLVQIAMVDLTAGWDGAVDMGPHDAVCADTSQGAVEPQHQAQIALTADGFSAARKRSFIGCGFAAMTPDTPAGVDAQCAVGDQCECAK